MRSIKSARSCGAWKQQTTKWNCSGGFVSIIKRADVYAVGGGKRLRWPAFDQRWKQTILLSSYSIKHRESRSGHNDSWNRIIHYSSTGNDALQLLFTSSGNRCDRCKRVLLAHLFVLHLARCCIKASYSLLISTGDNFSSAKTHHLCNPSDKSALCSAGLSPESQREPLIAFSVIWDFRGFIMYTSGPDSRSCPILISLATVTAREPLVSRFFPFFFVLFFFFCSFSSPSSSPRSPLDRGSPHYRFSCRSSRTRWLRLARKFVSCDGDAIVGQLRFSRASCGQWRNSTTENVAASLIFTKPAIFRVYLRVCVFLFFFFFFFKYCVPRSVRPTWLPGPARFCSNRETLYNAHICASLIHIDKIFLNITVYLL